MTLGELMGKKLLGGAVGVFIVAHDTTIEQSADLGSG